MCQTTGLALTWNSVTLHSFLPLWWWFILHLKFNKPLCLNTKKISIISMCWKWQIFIKSSKAYNSFFHHSFSIPVMFIADRSYYWNFCYFTKTIHVYQTLLTIKDSQQQRYTYSKTVTKSEFWYHIEDLKSSL